MARGRRQAARERRRRAQRSAVAARTETVRSQAQPVGLVLPLPLPGRLPSAEVDTSLETPGRALGAVRELVELQHRAQLALSEQVALAHRHGANWVEIGEALGVTRQAARQRFGQRLAMMTAPGQTGSHRFPDCSPIDTALTSGAVLHTCGSPMTVATGTLTAMTTTALLGSLLDRVLYRYSDVDRLLGLSAGTARRWVDGYTRAGRSYDPVLRATRTGAEVVTWGEFVECRLLAEYRDADVSLQRLRPAVQRLRDEFGPYPLAHARPLLSVEGRELVREVQDELDISDEIHLVVVRDGQLLLSDGIERFRQRVVWQDDLATALVPQETAPSVRIDPEHAFGWPSIRNVRTDAIAEDYRAGLGAEEIASLYELPLASVEDAIRYELTARRPQAA